MVKQTILITGGAGFIGSAFVRLLVRKNIRPIVLDKITYAGDLGRLDQVKGRFTFHKVDICDKKKVKGIFKKARPTLIVHFAAESHVDRSIIDAQAFLRTNIEGTQVLMDAARQVGIKKFLHISTDEVYGDTRRGSFIEDSPLRPSSPYAASKAAADLLIKSYMRTYGFPAIIIRPSNNYGPWQYPEKLIPLAILKASRREEIPLYADGKNMREWLYVEDCVEGILSVVKRGKNGQVYNLGSNEERQNIELVRMLLEIMGRPKTLIKFVKDRPGHDTRYYLDSSKVRRDCGWQPKITLKTGLKLTVRSYLENKSWLLNKHRRIAALYTDRSYNYGF
ncbi:MAG: dTDP-glucose 4,6-dehydratase [Candidatus Omnitrophica bacterium]|nr:dTDP-glucose 4,6-dehydratase [Candidatus Omnitrophota bacterium]